MSNLKTSIRESLRYRLLLEYVPLDVSKRLRKYQLDNNSDTILDELFGKGVFRLYYDLDSGNQVRAGKTTNNLPVEKVATLRDDINDTLSKFGYSVVSIEDNRAKNDKGQTGKLTKILNRVDKLLFDKYTSYLSVKNNTSNSDSDNRLCVVISRHSHDIADMGDKPRISSCADMSELTAMDLDNYFDDDRGLDSGGGQHDVVDAIRNGDIIFYLIKEGDWSIKDPISRFLGGRLCEFSNNHNFYGDFNESFAEFINSWLTKYGNRLNKTNSRTTTDLSGIDFSEVSLEELTYDDLISSSNPYTTNIVLSKLFKFDRFDIIEQLLTGSNGDLTMNHIDRFLGSEYHKALPKDIQNIISSKVLKESLNEDMRLLGFLYRVLKNPNSLVPAIESGFMDLIMRELEKARECWGRWQSHNKELKWKNLMQRFNRDEFDKAMKLTSYISKLLEERPLKDRIKDFKLQAKEN
jgi:hypothetical protein